MDESKFMEFVCSPYTGDSVAARAARETVRPNELKGLFVRELMNVRSEFQDVRSEFRDSLSAMASRVREDMLRVQGTVLDNSRADNKSLKAEMYVHMANACADLESRLAPEISKVSDLERELAKVKRAYDSLERRFSAECTARARQASDMNGMLKRLEPLEARRQDQTSAEVASLFEAIQRVHNNVTSLGDIVAKHMGHTQAEMSDHSNKLLAMEQNILPRISKAETLFTELNSAISGIENLRKSLAQILS